MTTGLLGVGVQIFVALSAGCDRSPPGTPLEQSSLQLALAQGDRHQVRLVREEILEQKNGGAREATERRLEDDVSFHAVDIAPDGTATLAVTLLSGDYDQEGKLADSDDLPSIFRSDYDYSPHCSLFLWVLWSAR